MKNLIKKTSLLAVVFTLSSCAAFDGFIQKKEPPKLDYIESSIKMDVKKFLDGDIDGFAIKQDFAGKITGVFTVKVNGKWEENKGVVQFNYRFNDGSKDSRTWLITVNTDNSFSAVGHDVVKPANGKQAGNAAQAIYSLNIGSNNNKKEIEFEDKFYMVDEQSAIMISSFKPQKSDKNSGGKVILSLKKVAVK